jgi:hypothetical protein
MRSLLSSITVIAKRSTHDAMAPMPSSDFIIKALITFNVQLQTVKPRPSPVTSIPGLLGLFHNVRLTVCVSSRPGEATLWHALQPVAVAGVPSHHEERQGSSSGHDLDR